MGLGDRIRSFFSKKSNPALAELEAFALAREGLEGFIEPQTPTSPTTLLLVDRDGDHLRGPVRDPQDAVSFCERLGIPIYDAKVIGYPKRMRAFDKRRKDEAVESLDDAIADLERRLSEPGTESPNN
jgi:hypothetical protein